MTSFFFGSPNFHVYLEINIIKNDEQKQLYSFRSMDIFCFCPCYRCLWSMKHPGLCTYLDIKRGKHERVMIVSEHYQGNLQNLEMRSSLKSPKLLAKLAFEILDAVSYLHMHDIIHRCLSPQNIRFDCEGHVKLSNYGLYYITECGTTVSFPIGVPKYMPPEVLARGMIDSCSSRKCDIWSLGIILLELTLEISLWSDFTLENLLKEILSLLKFDNGHEIVAHIVKYYDSSVKYESSPISLQLLIEECLNPVSNSRPESHQLLSHPFFEEHMLTEDLKTTVFPLSFLSTQLRCNGYEKMVKLDSKIDDHLSKRPLQELYYLWQLAGGDLEAELRRQELIKAKPPIVTVSKIITCEGEEFGHEKDQAFLLDDSVSILPLEPLKHRLRDVDYDIYYPLIEYSLNGISPSSFFATLRDTSKLPLVIKEKDVEYQLHRIVLFKRLLEAYPYKRTLISQECKLDIPPLYRPWVWAALLEIEICGFVPKIENQLILENLRINKIKLSDAFCYEDEICLLLGADFIGKLLTGKCVQLDFGLAAIHTKLGWIVIGKETGLSSSNNEIVVDSSVQTVLSLYVNDISLKELWEIDSLGIRDPIENV
ncbi:TBC domain-containing protein kinase-like protein [Trichonephila inaurata madagascariensis]|uniref:TBC domain-containing protein kinase-like protein n=1 Tax=Trichonephila inaurata madagascariensis TaxID=2747483 RepID=A0A8X6MCX7_9ARAC|nr:TBC domain-containing protein kinase-like protein [Trichonephila inaurata madagascariensis]